LVVNDEFLLEKLIKSSLKNISSESFILLEGSDDSDSGDRPRLLNHTVHSFEEGFVVIDELIDGFTGVRVARAATEKLVEAFHTGKTTDDFATSVVDIHTVGCVVEEHQSRKSQAGTSLKCPQERSHFVCESAAGFDFENKIYIKYRPKGKVFVL